MEVIVGLLISISIASERLVEITKGMIPWLATKSEDPDSERLRNMALQILAILAGIATAMMALPILRDHMPVDLKEPVVVLGVGILASGGSGFWNAVLTYVLKVKDIKSSLAAQAALPSGTQPNLVLNGEQVTSNECYDPEDR
jgi:hypothetical protein